MSARCPVILGGRGREIHGRGVVEACLEVRCQHSLVIDRSTLPESLATLHADDNARTHIAPIEVMVADGDRARRPQCRSVWPVRSPGVSAGSDVRLSKRGFR